MAVTRGTSIDLPEDDGSGPVMLTPTKRKYDLHPPGILYVLISVFLAIGALNSQNNLLFLAFGFAIAGFLVSGLISGPPLMRLRARRLKPDPTHIGESGEIRYLIENHGGWLSAMGLEIRELTDDEGRIPGRGAMASAGVACLRPRTRQTAVLRLTPTARGHHGLVGFTVTTTFPFGIFRKTMIFHQRQSWVVAPRRITLRNMPWHRAGRDGATLSSITARRGTSTEFYALRGYVPGDPTRRIAWLPSARVGELVVIEHASSAPPRIWIRIDEPGPTTPGHLVERGAALVSALASDATQAGFAVGLSGRGVGAYRPLSGPRQVRAIKTAMAGLGEHGVPHDADDPPQEPGHRTLRVRVEYQGTASSKSSTEFRLSAAEIERWYGDPTPPPPEFMPGEPEPGAQTPAARLAALARSVRGRLTATHAAESEAERRAESGAPA